MKFAIRDILLITFVVALGIVALQRWQRLRVLESDLASTQVNESLLESEMAYVTASLAMEAEKIEFCESYESINKMAVDHFQQITDRYGVLDAKPGVITHRRVPGIDAQQGVRVRHARIIVPQEYAVYLRSATCRRSSTVDRSSLDDEVWLTDAPFEDPQPRTIKLAPGVHDIRWEVSMTVATGMYSKPAWAGTPSSSDRCPLVETWLDGKQIQSSLLPNAAAKNSGSQSLSGAEALDIALTDQRPTQRLVEYRFRIDAQEEYQLIFWLSRLEDVEGYLPFGEASFAAEANDE